MYIGMKYKTLVSCLLSSIILTTPASSSVQSSAESNYTTEQNDIFINDNTVPLSTHTTPLPTITTIDISDCYVIEPKCDDNTKKLHLNISNVTEPSGATMDHIENFIEARTKWKGLNEYLISLDEKVNVIFLIAVARIETGAGEVCAGKYNCFNIKDKNGEYCNYNSYKESIDHFVRLITNEYINKDGMWHEGTGIRDIAINYCDHEWGETVVNLSEEIREICEENKPLVSY